MFKVIYEQCGSKFANHGTTVQNPAQDVSWFFNKQIQGILCRNVQMMWIRY